METPHAEVPRQATEGVVKYVCELVPASIALPPTDWRVLEAWRTVLKRLGIVGQADERYDGYAFGNLSSRSPDGFYITGTQTGARESLDPEHYAEVVESDLAVNRLWARGDVHPSSEALTHAAIYGADRSIGAVLHGHCPKIFGVAQRMQLPTIAAHVEYGTPAMARATSALISEHPSRPLVFVTLGHEDGVFALGTDVGAAGRVLVDCFAAALAQSCE